MHNPMTYECVAMVRNTIIATTVIEAEGIEEAKNAARKWLANLSQQPPATQIILKLGDTPAWATPLPELETY